MWFLWQWEKSPVERIKEEYEARETSPSPLSPTGKVSQNLEHLKSNREHIEEWWGKRTAGDGRPSLEQTFDGKEFMLYFCVLVCPCAYIFLNLWYLKVLL
jgi:hypothetical protein